jgi:transposase
LVFVDWKKAMRKVSSFVKVVCFVTAALIGGGALTSSVIARDHSDCVELTANQIAAELDARIARIKADLRLAPEQEESGPVSRVLSTTSARNELIARLQHERNAEKQLADAPQPPYASLDDQQKRRFADEVVQLNRALGIAQ